MDLQNCISDYVLLKIFTATRINKILFGHQACQCVINILDYIGLKRNI
jgi:hypothetical protein